MRTLCLPVAASIALIAFLPACSTDDPPGGGSVDGGGPDANAGDYYLPTVTTLTPFLSAAAQHEFAAAGDATEDGKDYLAVVETDAGRMVLDLHEALTPITVNSFVWLARHHYFDGIAFHRVIDGFVAQAGDPNTLSSDRSNWGAGGPGYQFGLEIVSELSYDGAGVLGMARTSDPGSNGSQFFITLAAAHNLDGQYTIFARVTEGAEVLPAIVRGEPPATPTRMTRVYVVERSATGG